MSDFTAFVSSLASGAEDSVAVAEASACLKRFTHALNAHDFQGMDCELSFPHIMLSGAARLVWEEPGQHPIDLFEELHRTGWRSTQYEIMKPVLVSAEKVHFVLTYTRRAAEGEILSTHTNLWIVTKAAGKWGIALRSY